MKSSSGRTISENLNSTCNGNKKSSRPVPLTPLNSVNPKDYHSRNQTAILHRKALSRTCQNPFPRNEQKNTKESVAPSSNFGQSCARSYSEVIKCNESLQSQIVLLTQKIKESGSIINAKEQKIVQLENQLSSLQKSYDKNAQQFQEKIDSLTTSYNERYQNLSDKYFTLIDKIQVYESKLENLQIDPVSLFPFDWTAEQRKYFHEKEDYKKKFLCEFKKNILGTINSLKKKQERLNRIFEESEGLCGPLNKSELLNNVTS